MKPGELPSGGVAPGLGQVGQPLLVSTDPITGFPLISVGHRVTSEDVAATLADESPDAPAS